MNILQRLKNSITAAVTREVFDSWKPSRQRQYLKDHPNSKFNTAVQNKQKSFNSKMTIDDSKNTTKNYKIDKKKFKSLLKKPGNFVEKDFQDRMEKFLKMYKGNETKKGAKELFQRLSYDYLNYNSQLSNSTKKAYSLLDSIPERKEFLDPKHKVNDSSKKVTQDTHKVTKTSETKDFKQSNSEPSKEFNETINDLSEKNYWFKAAQKVAKKAFNTGKINNDEDYEVIEDYVTGLSHTNPKDSYTKSYIKKLQTLLKNY